jgi:hypothetical protein
VSPFQLGCEFLRRRTKKPRSLSRAGTNRAPRSLLGISNACGVTMLLWASILAAILSGFGVVNYGPLPWIGDLIAVIFLISIFVAVCAAEMRT